MRRIGITAAVVLLLSLLLSVSALKEPQSSRSQQTDGKLPAENATGELQLDNPAMVHVTVSMETDEFEQLREYTNQFMMKYPLVTVMLENDEQGSKDWMEEAELGSGADVMLIDSDEVGRFAGRGLLLPTDVPGGGETAAELVSALVEPLKWNGYTWGTPKDADPYIAVWNASLLKEMGSAKAPGSWTDYSALAEDWAKRDIAVPFLYLSSTDSKQFAAWADAFPDEMQVSAEEELESGRLEERQSVKLAWLSGHMDYLQTEQLDDARELASAVAQGELLLGFIPWSTYTALSAAERLQLTVGEEMLGRTAMQARSFVIAASAEAPVEAALWVNEMTAPYMQQTNYEQYGRLPSVKSLYREGRKLEAAPPGWLLNKLEKVQAVSGDRESLQRLYEERERKWLAWLAGGGANNG